MEVVEVNAVVGAVVNVEVETCIQAPVTIKISVNIETVIK
jgi:hypothetical protein